MSGLHLIPAPAHLEHTAGAYPLDGARVIGPLAQLLVDELGADCGVAVGAATEAGIQLAIDGGGDPESYRLTVTPAAVRLTAADRAGLRYGIFTIGQLAERTAGGTVLPAVVIEDRPRFRYRGLMVDTVRHFFDVDTIKAVIDRAVRLKLNALHLHLTDDQGWRIETPSRPELTERASGTAAFGGGGGFYSVADYAGIVSYAAANDMVVVPEIDLPGHTHAVSLAYPDLVEAPVLLDSVTETIATFGGGVPVTGEPYQGIAVGFSSVRIDHEPTYEFLGDVLGDLAAATPGPWLHVGGDECLGTDPADFSRFMSRVTGMVAALGKTPVVWHEAGAAEALAPGTVGQFWGLRSNDAAVAAKARAFPAGGGSLILSPADCVYLDMKYDSDTPYGLVWADGPTSVERSYDWEPSELIDGVDEADILGVEAAVWTETLTNLAELDHMFYPRLASAAEIAWSPGRGTRPERTWESFASRVAGLGPLWESQGIALRRDPGADLAGA